MFCIDNAAKAKKSARSLEKSLEKAGINLVHGHALNAIAAMAGFVDWNAMLEDFKSTPQTSRGTSTPHILDIDYDRVSQVRVYGSLYEVTPERDALRILKDGSDEEHSEQDPDDIVLELASLNDEVYSDDVITVRELLDFTWDESAQCFVNSAGQQFQPLETKPYDFSLGKVADTSLMQDTSVIEDAETELNRYRVYVYCGSTFMGTCDCLGHNQAEAIDNALDELWDDRVERYEATTSVTMLDDDEDGDFGVYVDDECRFEEESFRNAYNMAKDWATQNPGHTVTVRYNNLAGEVKFTVS